MCKAPKRFWKHLPVLLSLQSLVCGVGATCMVTSVSEAQESKSVADAETDGKEPEKPKVDPGGFVQIKVLDDTGKPIKDCTVIGHGLRSIEDPSTGYGWAGTSHGPIPVAKTDALGVVKLPYPKWVVKQLQITTGGIIAIADHPDFCLKPNIECSVGAGPTEVQLQSGGRLRAYALRGAGKEPVTGFRVLMSGHWEPLRPWENLKSGNKGILSPAMTAGTRLIRVVHREDSGQLTFSRLISFKSVVGRTESRLLRLKTGMSVKGRLSVHAFRPVSDGFVVAVIANEVTKENYSDSIMWQTFSKITPEGTFEFDQLPPSKEIRLLAMCDGFVSRQPDVENLPPQFQRNRGLISLPQFFHADVEGEFDELEVRMEAAASCRFKVVDKDGKGIANATVGFFPNVTYSSGNTLFGMAGRSELLFDLPTNSLADTLKSYQSRNPFADKTNDKYLRPTFHSVTDENGDAFVKNIPPRGLMGMHVSHDSFVPADAPKPPHRIRKTATMTSGKTTSVRITMIPKPEPPRK